jgi:hypothetical protein
VVKKPLASWTMLVATMRVPIAARIETSARIRLPHAVVVE